MHQFYRGTFFNFEAIRILGTARYGGAEVAEFLDAIGSIPENDPVSWHRVWSEQAQKAETLAEEAQQQGQRGAARMAFLRASNYTRASAYMMTTSADGQSASGSDARVVPILKKAVERFRRAVRLFDGPVYTLQVPYHDDGTSSSSSTVSLPAYLYLPRPSCRLPGKIPLVVTMVGADSIQEEIYYTLPAEGPDLGYAVLTFEGPGQGLTLHEHGITMRSDWEVVTQVVMDYVVEYAKHNEELVDLDWERVAVAGASLGGYFALRAAAAAAAATTSAASAASGPWSNFKACVAVDPLYDLYDFATEHVSPSFFQLWAKGWIPDWFVDGSIWLGMRFSFQTKWEIGTTSRFLGTTRPTGLLRAMKRYTLRQAEGQGSLLDQIKCPVLVTGAADSLYLEPSHHTAVIFQAIKSAGSEVWVARTPGEGSLQAKVGAMALCNQRAFAFLDKQFAIERRRT